MNTITRAGLLLNAVKAPYDLFIKLCDHYDPDEILTGPSFWEELGLTQSQQDRLASYLAKDDWAGRELEHTHNFGAKFITAKDIDYPAKLKDLKHPPIGLYVKGKVNLSLPSVAIVGTRKNSDYGRTTATNLARALASSGIIVVSGGARGIDTSAHRGSLSGDGVTVAVFGTGIDKVYPTENRDLFSRIAENGALVSEYPVSTGGEAWRFPERNRIIAAMASRVVVVESPEGGGAMHTAKIAMDLGRELWTVPGRISDEVSRGSNRLLSYGAKAAVSIQEFVESLTGQISISFDDNEPDKPEQKKYTHEMTNEEKIIYSLLQTKDKMTLDEIASESNLNLAEVHSAIMELEAENLITDEAGRYSAQ